MSDKTWIQIYECLSNNHLCCLIQENPLDPSTEVPYISNKFYNHAILVISLNLNQDITQNGGRDRSNQGWYETFFNLILGELQRSSFSVTSEQRRGIRNQSRLMIDTLNPFLEFYKVLENIASTKQRSFLLHLTEIHCLDDPKSNLSERDVRFFLEAIDSYCTKFLDFQPESPAESSKTSLYFLLEGNRFPQSEKLNEPQVLGQSIVNLNPPAEIITPESVINDVIIDNQEQSKEVSIDPPTSEVIQVVSGTEVLMETSTSDTFPIDFSTSSTAPNATTKAIIADNNQLNKTGNQWLTTLGLVGLGFVSSALLVPVILSQPEVQSLLGIAPNAIPTPTPTSTSIPTPTPTPTFTTTSTPTSTPTPTLIPRHDLTESKAIEIVQNWLNAKSQIFAPPWNTNLASQYITGVLYWDITKPEGSVDWLRSNSSYYRYDASQITDVWQFDRSESQPWLKVRIYENRTLYGRNGIDQNQSGQHSGNFTYWFEKDNNTWKIYDYKPE